MAEQASARPVGSVSGIGPKKAERLSRLKLLSLGDVLLCYPRDYEDQTVLTRIADISEDGKYTLRAVVGTQPTLSRIRKGLTLVKAKLFDQSGTIGLIFFNMPYAAAQLREGQEYIFYGRVQVDRQKTLVSPRFARISPESAYKGRIVPVYPLTAGITQRDMLAVSEAALGILSEGDFADPIPPYLLKEFDLLGEKQAILAIHRPNTLKEVAQARRRMVFEELFLLCCGLHGLKSRRKTEAAPVYQNLELSKFWNALPFAPTGAQKNAIDELCADLASGRPMNRLVQGDVGAGKTVVAAALCYLAVQNGWQAAFMAPTEILATQHEKTLQSLLAPMGLRVGLLLGAQKAAEKRQMLSDIAAGELDVVVGTHALIQKSVAFARLGAVVADEQHRFGVAQRAALAAKGQAVHTLVMSATPIPRTLALILYGDLDVTILDELPPGRTPIETYMVGQPMRRRITAFIEKQVGLGGQVYVVCPQVSDEQGESGIKSAVQHGQDLQRALPHRRIAVLHGQMKSAEKDEVMRAFAAGKTDILVSTTVIEVGVDVPNACLMVVEDADRFGLSQLHQLRGRVGRGSRTSYCILFGADKGEAAKERLSVLCRTTDGFAIAQADLTARGPGDFFGRRQHGLPMLRLADLAGDLALMQQARARAEQLLENDPQLAGYPALRERVDKMLREAEDEAFN